MSEHNIPIPEDNQAAASGDIQPLPMMSDAEHKDIIDGLFKVLEVKRARDSQEAPQLDPGDKPWVPARAYADMVEARQARKAAEAEGAEPNEVQDYADSNSEPVYLAAARQDLSDMHSRWAEDLDDTQLGAFLVEHDRWFRFAAQEARTATAAYIPEFVERMRFAIDHQGFPLTHEELEARTKDITIQMYDMNFVDSNKELKGGRGNYNAKEGVIAIVADGKIGEYKHRMFHELVHRVSAHTEVDGNISQSRRRGHAVSHPATSERAAVLRHVWENEATDDLITQILLDEEGTSVNFADNSFWDSELVHKLSESWSKQVGYYNQEKIAMVQTHAAVPATSLPSFMTGNNNRSETDKRAGTHAEREYQRSLKLAGGLGRVTQHRQIEKAFAIGDHEQALRLSAEVKKADAARTPEELAGFKTELEQLQAIRAEQIEGARSYQTARKAAKNERMLQLKGRFKVLSVDGRGTRLGHRNVMGFRSARPLKAPDSTAPDDGAEN